MNLQLNEIGIRWPFPVDYEKINRMDCDILVIGAGAAGSCAGISVARKGARVIVCEKGASKRAGNCGAGIDHWNELADLPQSSKTAEEKCTGPRADGMNKMMFGHMGPAQLHRNYIATKGTWDALMELEKMGLPIRDEDGDFDGCPTQDENSKLLKGYNYAYMDTVKLRGGNYVIPVLNKCLKEAGAVVLDRIMMTKLLTESGIQGNKVVGAIGFSTETGELYVINSKAVIIASGYVCTNWISNTDITGNSYKWDPNDIGEGLAMAYLAGAKTDSFCSNGATKGSHPFAWPRFGVGSSGNTWAPCTIVDNKGREVPWVYRDGRVAETVQERSWYENDGPHFPHNVMEAVKRGEYEMPFWADISSMPERERRSIWGMMIGNEGKTRYTLYDYYTRCGFNPEKHMLFCPIDPELGIGNMHGDPNSVRQWRSERGGQGELVVDWDMMTSVPGLFVAGAASGLEGCSYACASGFYAGKRAFAYAQNAKLEPINEEQMLEERQRILAPTKRTENKNAYISWKELWSGTARVMQQCCADYLSESTLALGLEWLDSIKRNEAQLTFARNPHELARVMECETRLTIGSLYMNACISKIKADTDGLKDNEFLINYLEDGEFSSEIRSGTFYLEAPYFETFEENYNARAQEVEK